MKSSNFYALEFIFFYPDIDAKYLLSISHKLIIFSGISSLNYFFYPQDSNHNLI